MSVRFLGSGSITPPGIAPPTVSAHAVTVSRTTDNLARFTPVHAAEMADRVERGVARQGERREIPVMHYKLRGRWRRAIVRAFAPDY